MKASAIAVCTHQVTLWRIFACPGSMPANASARTQPPKDQTSQGGRVTRIRRASMMKPVTMIPAKSSKTTASSGVLSDFPW